MPDAATPKPDSKLIAAAAQRTTETLSKWAVPGLLAVAITLGKLAYDGLIGGLMTEAERTRVELRNLREDGVDRDLKLGQISAVTERNAKWIDRSDETQRKLLAEMAAIRAVLAPRDRTVKIEPESHR